MKKLSSIISILLIIVSIVISSTGILTFSFSTDSTQTPDNSYYIQNYSAEFEFESGRTFAVTEKVTAVFRVPGKHGIIRDLATNSGEVYSDVSVHDAPYNVKSENVNFLSIYIGNEDVTVPYNTPIQYTISYRFKIPERSNRDEFAINVLGGGWATKIENFDCKITLPSSPSEIKIAGRNLTQSGSGNVYNITSGDLNAFEGITLYAIFNSGTLAAFGPDAGEIVAVLVAFLALAAVIALSLMLPKRMPVEVVNFYPPKGMDPLEAGTLIDGTANNEDVTSILYYWASKGYINIDFSDEKDPVLILSNALPSSAPSHQKMLFEQIFANRDRVNVSSLTNKLAAAAQTVKSDVASKTPAAFSRKSRLLSIAVTAGAAIIYIATLIGRALRVGLFFPLAFIALFGPLCIYLTGDFAARNRLKYSKKKRTLLFIAQIAETIAFALIAFFLVPQTFILNYMDALLVIACCSTAVAAPYLLRYTQVFCDAAGPLLGFRNFIEIAEKDKLEKMINENPSYYYDVLPYAQVMGVSDVWEEKFKGINLDPPAWASGYNYSVFDYILFSALMRNTWRGVARAFVPPPSSSGRSGGGRRGGGGGFHIGGGFGGGGGRSW